MDGLRGYIMDVEVRTWCTVSIVEGPMVVDGGLGRLVLSVPKRTVLYSDAFDQGAFDSRGEGFTIRVAVTEQATRAGGGRCWQSRPI